MQEAGRGRQRGQQLPGFRAGASFWPPPQTWSDTRQSPRSPKQRLTEDQGALGLPNSLREGSGHRLVAAPGTAGPWSHRSTVVAQAQVPPFLRVASGWWRHVSTHPTALTAALTGPQESGEQRCLWQCTVPATQEQMVQASTVQRSPEATCRPWCGHDWAGAKRT